MPSTLAPVLPIAPPQTGTGDTIPSSVALSKPQQQQVVLVSQPSPLVTIVSVAPPTVVAPVPAVPSIESASQPKGETAQSLDSSDVDYT